jgi:polysaccharide biosynthesis protein PslA
MADAHLTQTPRPRDGWGHIGDLVIAGALVALTLPLTAIIALAIKCDSRGPVFIWEECVDARGRRFAALKFRTAAHDSDLGSVIRLADVVESVTGVGWVLRYTRMDRLPQLINVLRGEMTCIKAGADRPFFLE